MTKPKEILSVAAQREVVRGLRQEVAAELVGLNVRTLRRRDDLPVVQYNRRTLLYDGPELVALYLREAKAVSAAGEEDLSNWGEDDKAAYIRARTRKANADAERAEHELRVQRGELLRREAVHRLLSELAAALRSAGETLYERFGDDASALMDAVLTQVDRQMALRQGAEPAEENE